jgi:putative tryptophan/tyrosine transport system substrate-binding protein
VIAIEPMNRRVALALLCACVGAVVPPALAQALPAIGFLNSASAANYSFNAAAFRDGLREAGFVEGRNVVIEYRWAENDYSRLPALAEDLARRKVAVIAATGDIASARAAQAATRTIPIVFTVGSDPVPFGLVSDLARPGGNATGVTLFSSTLMAKRMEFLRQVVPRASSIALLMNPDNLNYDVDARAARDAARSFGLQTTLLNARTPSEIDAAFATIAQSGAGAVLIASDPMFLGQREKLAALGARHALPVVSWTRDFAVAGGLLSYGTSITWMYREAGKYAGRILKGAKPGELPVIQPTEFELVVNLKTARSLGLVVPEALLLRANEVIR